MKAVRTTTILTERLGARKMEMKEKSHLDGNRNSHSFPLVGPTLSGTSSAARQAFKELAGFSD